MLDELLEKKLKGLKNEDILVVMDDGIGFLGELVEFDRKTLVLKEVYQAPCKEIDWKEVSSETDEVKMRIEDGEKVGFIDWTKVNLEEVYIRVAHTTRIWRWPSSEKEKQAPKKDVRRPVYTKSPERQEERVSSMGDIQNTFPG